MTHVRSVVLAGLTAAIVSGTLTYGMLSLADVSGSSSSASNVGMMNAMPNAMINAMPNAMTNRMGNAIFNGWGNAMINGMQNALPNGVQPGVQAGLQSGIQAGAQAGLQSGIQAGAQAGLQSGIQAGAQAGLQSGMQSGLQQGCFGAACTRGEGRIWGRDFTTDPKKEMKWQIKSLERQLKEIVEVLIPYITEKMEKVQEDAALEADPDQKKMFEREGRMLEYELDAAEFEQEKLELRLENAKEDLEELLSE